MTSPVINDEDDSSSPLLSVSPYPAFLRKLTRKSHWEGPLRNGDPERASSVFIGEDDSTSVYLVHDDVELRRIAVAMNEYRPSKREEVNLLPIRPCELQEIGIEPLRTPSEFHCHLAKKLHHDLVLDQQAAIALSQVLIDARREATRCTKSKMAKALVVSEVEGCFSVTPESRSCACGGNRS